MVNLEAGSMSLVIPLRLTRRGRRPDLRGRRPDLRGRRPG